MHDERIFVLGHRGMLGSTVASYFNRAGVRIVTSSCRYTGRPDDEMIRSVVDSGCRWIINALGRIRQKSGDTAELYLANTIFPQHLLYALRPEQRLLHASTDCVFSGNRGWYETHDPKDPSDTYGLSKSLGESIASDPRALVIRSSIIGPEVEGNKGLFGWFLQQTDKVRGYTDHLWNGITTLEWAEAAMEVIQGAAPKRCGVVQLGTSKAVSKCELLMLINDTWSRGVEIESCQASERIDRTLRPDWTRPPIAEQLLKLHCWMSEGRAAR